eukprot:351513-Chlamydomonas_euryale.AAC.1
MLAHAAHPWRCWGIGGDPTRRRGPAAHFTGVPASRQRRRGTAPGRGCGTVGVSKKSGKLGPGLATQGLGDTRAWPHKSNAKWSSLTSPAAAYETKSESGNTDREARPVQQGTGTRRRVLYSEEKGDVQVAAAASIVREQG